MVTDIFKPPVHTTLPFDRSPSPFPWAAKKGNLPEFSDFDPYEQSDSIHDYLTDLVAGQDVKGVASNASFSSFCYSNGSGPAYNDGLLGVGHSQPNTSLNSRPSEKGYQSRGVLLLPEHGQTNLSDRGVHSLSRTEWEDWRKNGLSFRSGQQLGPTQKDPEGKLRFLLLGDDESDNGEGELLLWEANNPPDQDDSWIKVIHEEHSVMLQNLSKTHSTKVALNLWLFGEEVAFQLGDVKQDQAEGSNPSLKAKGKSHRVYASDGSPSSFDQFVSFVPDSGR
ncbi:hypothetical protein E3N88_25273 [Mikania micrantha]|uniref:Uncharacterized protein n=1 Tax=Mikania micrantha TaxID=192012 RepID=A0A5N6N4A7_9ASTR|nr:hypothetical protein E3N88_25273 [Mikania micrantha]